MRPPYQKLLILEPFSHEDNKDKTLENQKDK